jgi:hypothetical protein
MTSLYQSIYSDLHETDTVLINSYQPYENTDEFAVKIQKTYRFLLRAKRLKNRIATLEFAFYIGQLLEAHATPSERTFHKNILSEHYLKICVRTYYIFEALGIEQIYRTRLTTTTIISRLSSTEYKELALLGSNIFVGSQIIEEELVDLVPNTVQ